MRHLTALSMLTSLALPLAATAQTSHRPPAVPLIAHDPYFSVWSTTDQLYGGATKHWTGTAQPLSSLIRVDGRTFRLMGATPEEVPALPQTDLEVLPTRTIYTFRNEQVEVRLTFTTPALPDDLDVFARPATYVTWTTRSVDAKSHDVSVYFDAGSELAVNRPEQRVVWGREKVGGLTALRVGTQDQTTLITSGDDLRIDWGYLYVAAPEREAASVIATRVSTQSAFASTGKLPARDDARMPRAVANAPVALAFAVPFGAVGTTPVSHHLTVAYDDHYSIQFFNRNLRPYWRRKGADAAKLLTWAARDYDKLSNRCAAFDAEVLSDLEREGGENYAYIASLAYRQSFAAQKLVADAKGQPLMFSKENFSNGCIATVDILYPTAPQLLLFSPTLTKASLVPVLEYAASPRWKWPFAPHDLGTYPLANGQVYGGGERTEENQMPVEESGNILIVLAALAKEEGNAKFSEKYWPLISKWAAYLADKGFDPESQLSTDDFAGHLAHNVNLSAKAIEALGAYAQLADMLGKKEEATKYRTMAQGFADRWVKEASDGDHYRLAFDRPGTWSQKYNLVWDRLLGINLFPTSVARTEMDFYKTKLNPYGLPLDNRRDYTKLDWVAWTATLTGDRNDFTTLIDPVAKFLDETPDRAPMGDWFQTIRPRKEGFQARAVVGGVFVKMLENGEIWRKYVARDKAKVGGWSPIPKPPIVTLVVPTALEQPVEWSYTTSEPAAGWNGATFDTTTWSKGPSGFGSNGTPGANVRTQWTTNDIWIRRDFDLAKRPKDELELLIHHDEDAEVYINGVLATRLGGFVGKYTPAKISPAALASLHVGRNSIAIHCHQTTGGQYIDAGLCTVKPAQ